MFCGECGTQNPDTNTFCKNCGKPLKKTHAAQPVATPAPQPVPAAAPVQPAQQSYYIPPAGVQQQAPTVPAAAAATAATAKPKHNWAGIGSVIFAVLSWILYPVALGVLAVVCGIAGIYLAKKRKTKIPVSAVIGIIIGLLAIVVNIFWLDIFPPKQVLPPIQ